MNDLKKIILTPNKLDKISLGLSITIIVIFIMSSIILIGTYLDDMPDYRSELLSIKESVVQELNNRWKVNINEFGVCLIIEDRVITGWKDVKYEGNGDNLEFLEECLEDSFELHSHPSRSCDLSAPDGTFFMFRNVKKGTVYQGIMCGKDKIIIYGIDNLKTPYRLEII